MVACSQRWAPKNYPSEGNFLEASCDNVERTVVQIFGRKILPEHMEHSQAIEPSKQIPKFATCIFLTILIMQMMHTARHLRVESPKHKEEVRCYPNDFLPNAFRLFRSHNYHSPNQQHWLPVVSARHKGRRTNILAAQILFTLNHEKNTRL